MSRNEKEILLDKLEKYRSFVMKDIYLLDEMIEHLSIENKIEEHENELAYLKESFKRIVK